MIIITVLEREVSSWHATLIRIPHINMKERDTALDILIDYEKNNSYLNITLNHTLTKDFSAKERGLITTLVYGTIQNRLYLEYQLEPHIHTRLKVVERMLLLMSLYQHFYLDMPDYAIVNEAVDIIKERRNKRAGGMINAILHSCFKETRSLDNLDEDTYLSISTSHPLWLVKMFKAQYGLETTKKILKADNEVPLKTGRVNTYKISRADFLKQYPAFKEGHLSKDSVLLEEGNIAHTEAFKQGLVTIQDESSQMVARLLDPSGDDIVLDMCGAPGSKTTHLGALMHNKGLIDVYDLYPHKAKLIQDNASRLGLTNIHVHTGDSTDLSLFDKKYTKILLDGPCSGLGVLSRKPEIKYHDSNIMDEIILIQSKLLENAYSLCLNGGRIVYSTCTLNKKENEKQIAAFLKKHPDIHIIKERTILPYEYHSDGFYMCLLEKDV